MPSTLDTEQTRAVLERLRLLGDEQDGDYSARVHAREAALGEKLYGLERAEIGAQAPQAIASEVGRILYSLMLATRPNLAVEFGASLGSSTIHLAAALNDLGTGRLITTELIEAKAEATAANLEAVGLAHLVEMRQGDAQTTLRHIDEPIDFLFLDGSNDLYIPILEMLQPQLSPRAVVAADLSAGDPHHDLYRRLVSDVNNGYISIEIPVDAGLLVTTKH